MSSKDEQDHCPLPSHLWAWHSLCFSSKGVLEVPTPPAPDVAENDFELANRTSGKQGGREAVPASELALQACEAVSFPPFMPSRGACTFVGENSLDRDPMCHGLMG